MSIVLPKSLRFTCFHLWFPNLFDFKGGIQVYLQDLLLALEDKFPRLPLVIFDKLDKTKSRDKFESKELSFLFSGSLPSFLRSPHFALSIAIGSLIERPNLILCGHLNFAPIAFLIHRLTGVPYWIFVYGIDAWSVQDHWKQKALHSAEKIISISGYTSSRLIREQKLAPERISLLPVTFDASRFQIKPKPQHLLSRYGLTAEPIILTVARLDSMERYKGYDQILQALPEIRRQIPTIHYLIVGKGSDRPRIEQLIVQLNLQECVTLTGFVTDDELCDHYNMCDVFAMPSKAEGFGIVYLEALACGRPTLGGNQDGAIDALCHGELGALVNPDDVEEIAQTLIQILQGIYPNPLIYQPEALRKKVIDTFGFERFKQTLAELMQTSSVGSKL
ncbi:glycosyltransferase [Nostoc sp.]|uniref:glycosyltransferase n=1 Tax=Nostoc sp. TaxID=1180 RepID=UPI0035947B74